MNNKKLQQKYNILISKYEEKMNQKNLLVQDALGKIQPEIDKIDSGMEKIGDKMDKLHDQIMQGLLERGDLDY